MRHCRSLPYGRFSFFFSSRRRHTRCGRDWSSDVCSSDLILESGLGGVTGCDVTQIMPIGTVAHETGHGFGLPDLYSTDGSSEGIRSEEHTSELQSRPHLVCRLLLEKKK